MTHGCQTDVALPPAPEPHTVEIELTNHCNAKCTFCPHGRMERPKGYMELGAFDSMLDELRAIRPHLWLNRAAGRDMFPKIVFAGLGEPLLHADAAQFVASCRRHGFTSELVTNGIRLEAGSVRALADAGLSKLAISLHSADARVYHEIVGVPLDKVLPRVDEALEAAQDTPLAVELWRVLPPPGMARTQSDEPVYADLRRRYPSLSIVGPSEPWERDGQVPASVHPEVNDFPLHNVRCSLLYFTLNVSWDGETVMCCIDYHRRTTPLGNVFTDPLQAVMDKRKALVDHGPTPALCMSCRKWPDTQYRDIYRDHLAAGVSSALRTEARPLAVQSKRNRGKEPGVGFR